MEHLLFELQVLIALVCVCVVQAELLFILIILPTPPQLQMLIGSLISEQVCGHMIWLFLTTKCQLCVPRVQMSGIAFGRTRYQWRHPTMSEN